jgi:tetratricopeptide (TPR) repeat protein/4-hydroxybenzoate polyprenyltransferase
MRFLNRFSAAGADVFAGIERSAGQMQRWLPLLCGWILLRNLLESIVEAPHQMGFDWRGEVSFPMQFLHFPAFYFVLFLVFTLAIQRLTRRPLMAVAGVVATGFGLLLVAPIVDGLLSSGQGYDLKYMSGFGSILWRFWDLTAVPSEVSPGQRVEIVLALLLVAAYIYCSRRADGNRQRKSIGLVLVGVAGLYIFSALLGAWPSLFAAMFKTTGTVNDAYVRLFRGPGLIASESLRHGLVMVLPLVVLLPLFYRQLAVGRFSAVIGQLAWSRFFYYSGLVWLGGLLAWLLYRDYLPESFANPIDGIGLFILWVAMAWAYLAASFWNDLCDQRADEINEPNRALCTGLLTAAETARLGWLSAFTAVFLALCVGYQPFLWLLAVLIISWIYSYPPVRLKRWPFVATFTLALLSLCSAGAGFSIFAQEMTAFVFPRSVAAIIIIGVTLGFNAKDLKDADGDRRNQTISIATLFSPLVARRLVAVLTAIGYLCVPLLLPASWWVTLICVIWAVGSVYLTLRLIRPDTALLIALIGFAALMLLLLSLSPNGAESLSPDPYRSLHGELRVATENQRLLRLDQEQTGLSFAIAANPLAPSDRHAHREQWRRNINQALQHIGELLPLATAYADESSQGAWIERSRWLGAYAAPVHIRANDFAALSRRRPLDVNYREQWAAALHECGYDEKAINVCSQAISQMLRPGDFLQNRAALQIGMGEGESDLAGAFRFNGGTPLTWVLAGDLRVRQQRFEEAVDCFNAALELDPDLTEAHVGLGDARYRMGQMEEAITAYAAASRLDPQNPLIVNNYGVALRDAGRTAEAITVFKNAHELAPTFYEPLYNLGLTYKKLGRQHDAQQWFSQAKRLQGRVRRDEMEWSQRISRMDMPAIVPLIAPDSSAVIDSTEVAPGDVNDR